MFGSSFNVPSTAEGLLRTILSQTDLPSVGCGTVQFRSGWCVHALGKTRNYALDSVCQKFCFPRVPFQTVPVLFGLMMTFSRPFEEDSRALPLSAPFPYPLLPPPPPPPPQEIDIVMSLGLSPRPVSRASQQFRSYDVHAICEGCGFTRQLHHGFPYRRKTNTCLSLFEAVMSGRQASNRRVEDVDLNELCWHLSSRNNQSSQPRLP